MSGKKTVKDPICGMQVDPEMAIRRDVGGATYYFCSESCAKRFEKSGAPEHSSHQHEDHGCC